MRQTLAAELFDCGIVQFGQFATADGTAPVRFDLLMLPSYPSALNLLARACVGRIQLAKDGRLCCALNTFALGVAIGQIMGQPLVYTTSFEHETPHTFIGAYDIGHPALLLWSWEQSILKPIWAERMREVGLVLERQMILVGDETSILPFSALLDALVNAGRIRPVQAETCLHWYHQAKLRQG